MNKDILTDKKRKAIKRVVLAAEKKLSIDDYYMMSNVASADELAKAYSTLDGLVYEGRRFRVMLKTFVEGSYRNGATISYIVTDRKAKIEYKVIHYCPNSHFDNTFGWFIEEKDERTR